MAEPVRAALHSVCEDAVQPGIAAQRSGAVAFLEFFVAAARARVVATNVFQSVANRLLRFVVAVRAVDMTVIVVMVMRVIVVTIRAVHVGLLVHQGHSGIKSPGIMSQFPAIA